MEQIKELTKRLIANSFKELMTGMPFEKITIKMVTDHANVIRPTFYNHFHDKYEVLEWLVQDEILSPAREQMLAGNVENGMYRILAKFYEDRVFYRKAFEVIGQNGFAEMLSEKLTEFMSEVMQEKKVQEADNPVLSIRFMAEYFASGIITIIRAVVDSNDEDAIEQYSNAYGFLATHTIFDITNPDNK